MSLYQDVLAGMIQMEVDNNDATREDFERALNLVFGRDQSIADNYPIFGIRG